MGVNLWCQCPGTEDALNLHFGKVVGLSAAMAPSRVADAQPKRRCFGQLFQQNLRDAAESFLPSQDNPARTPAARHHRQHSKVQAGQLPDDFPSQTLQIVLVLSAVEFCPGCKSHFKPNLRSTIQTASSPLKFTPLLANFNTI